MITKIEYNKANKDNDNVLLLDFDFVNDFVLYYDNVNDILFVNDFDFDLKANNDNDFVYIDNNIDFVLKSNINYTLLDNVKKIRQCYKDIDNINDIINDIDFVNVNKYIYDIINVNDIDFVFDKVLNDNNVYLLDINNDIDFDIVNDFVLLKMNKDIYNDNYFDFVKDNVFLLSYCIYNYDNDNVNVIIDKQRLNYVLNNLNYSYMTLSLKKTYDFLFNQLDKNNRLFNQLQSQYMTLINKNDKKSQLLKQRLIKIGKAKQSNIKKLQSKLNNVNDNIKDITMIRQYIIKNNCYYDNLNKLTNLCYKSFKNDSSFIDLKDKVKDIDNDNKKVNDTFKNVKDFIKVNDIDFDKNFNININFNDIDIDKDLFNDIVNDINKVLNDFKKSNDFDKGYILKDIIKDLNNIQSSLISDKHYYEYLKNDNDNINDIVNDIINEYKDINFDNYIDLLKNDIKKVYNDKIIKTNNNIDLLDIFIDFLINIKVKDNDNDTIYEYDIFNSHMNKHNSIIKVEHSDFLKVCYDEYLNDFYYSD